MMRLRCSIVVAIAAFSGTALADILHVPGDFPTIQEAVDAARFRHQSGRRVAIEAVGPDVRNALTALGHEISDWMVVAFGGAQVIMKLGRGWAAASDARKDGMAVGH